MDFITLRGIHHVIQYSFSMLAILMQIKIPGRALQINGIDCIDINGIILTLKTRCWNWLVWIQISINVYRARRMDFIIKKFLVTTK